MKRQANPHKKKKKMPCCAAFKPTYPRLSTRARLHSRHCNTPRRDTREEEEKKWKCKHVRQRDTIVIRICPDNDSGPPPSIHPPPLHRCSASVMFCTIDWLCRRLALLINKVNRFTLRGFICHAHAKKKNAAYWAGITGASHACFFFFFFLY